jgi:hypothetical protein
MAPTRHRVILFFSASAKPYGFESGESNPKLQADKARLRIAAVSPRHSASGNVLQTLD